MRCPCPRFVRCVLLAALCFSVLHAHTQVPPSVSEPQMAFTGKTMPLLSLDSLKFLEGTWSAVSKDGKQTLGSYTFRRELNGTVLSRVSAVDANCDPAKQAACGRRDLFYVYQDSTGAPLKAISFDSEGHVLHYLVNQAAEASTSMLGQRQFVFFDTDPAFIGPRFRLRYVRNVDTATGKESISGAFEMLLPDGSFRDLQQWYGTRQ